MKNVIKGFLGLSILLSTGQMCAMGISSGTKDLLRGLLGAVQAGFERGLEELWGFEQQAVVVAIEETAEIADDGQRPNPELFHLATQWMGLELVDRSRLLRDLCINRDHRERESNVHKKIEKLLQEKNRIRILLGKNSARYRVALMVSKENHPSCPQSNLKQEDIGFINELITTENQRINELKKACISLSREYERLNNAGMEQEEKVDRIEVDLKIKIKNLWDNGMHRLNQSIKRRELMQKIVNIKEAH